MALLVSRVLGDEVKVLAANDEGTVHFGRDDGSGEDTATDADVASEWALLVCKAQMSDLKSLSSRSERLSTDVVALNRSLWCPEA